MREKPDIYLETCLHPGVMADGVAERLRLDRGRLYVQRLLTGLELWVCRRYADDPKFRHMLRFCRNGAKALPGQAEEQRDLLSAMMLAWVGGWLESEPTYSVDEIERYLLGWLSHPPPEEAMTAIHNGLAMLRDPQDGMAARRELGRTPLHHGE